MQVKIVFNYGDDVIFEIGPDVSIQKITCQGSGKEFYQGFKEGSFLFEYHAESIKEIVVN